MKFVRGRIAGLSMCKLKFEDKKWFNQWKKKKKHQTILFYMNGTLFDLEEILYIYKPCF